MAVMPFCKVELRGQKPLPPSYPKELKTLGDHIRKRRLDLGLSQRQAATRLGVHSATVFDWEKDRRPIDDRNLGRIYTFLGYRPDPIPQSFPKKLKYWRQSLGLSQIQLSLALGLNHSAVCNWERSREAPSLESMGRLRRYFQEHLGKEVAI